MLPVEPQTQKKLKCSETKNDKSPSEIQLTLFKNIQNLAEIKDMIETNKLKAAVVNPLYIFHIDQLMFAAHKSMYNAQNQQLKTKTIFTEVLYNLSPSRSIKDALRTFGVQEDAWSIRAVFVTFSQDRCQENLDVVNGRLLDIDDISEVNNVNAIRKLYKVPDDMSDDEDILNCILTRMASKDVL